MITLRSGLPAGTGQPGAASALPACQPAFAPTWELSDASVIQGPSGSMLGAVSGTLTTPLPVWLNEVSAPSVPLFDDAVPRGAYYNAGAECTTFAPQGAPFALALPVPEDADTSKLGVAVLTPARYLTDARRDGVVWELASGVYDPDSHLYFIPRAALLSEGSTFILVEHPDVRPMTSRRSKLRGEAVAPPVFVVRCSAMAAEAAAHSISRPFTMDWSRPTGSTRAKVFPLRPWSPTICIVSQRFFQDGCEPLYGDIHQSRNRPYLFREGGCFGSISPD